MSDNPRTRKSMNFEKYRKMAARGSEKVRKAKDSMSAGSSEVGCSYNQENAATKIVATLEKELSQDKVEKDLLVSVQNCLGNCYIRLESYEDAEASFRAAVKEDGSSWKAKCNLAHVLYIRNTGKTEALALAEKAYKAEGDNEFAVSIYLLCLSFNNKQAEFDKTLKDRAAMVAKSSEVQLALAQIHKEKKNYTLARECFEIASALDKNNVHIQIILAETIYKEIRTKNMSLIANDILPKLEDSKADIEAAIKGLDSAILTLSETSDRKGHFRAYELRAVLNVLNGDFKSAKTDCYKMSAILPDDESCKIIAGQIFTQTNEFDEADKLLEPLAEGRRRDVLQILAYSNHKLGNHDMASKYFTGYIEDSDSDQEWTAYLQSLWLSGERKKAYQAALNLRKAGRASVMIMRDVELKRLIEMEEWAAALDVLEDLVKAEPDNAEHYLNRLAMNMNLGRKEHILEVYEALPRQLIESDGWASTKLALMEKGLRNGKIPNLSS